MNIFQRNLVWNSKSYTQEDAFENAVCKMAAICTHLVKKTAISFTGRDSINNELHQDDVLSPLKGRH